MSLVKTHNNKLLKFDDVNSILKIANIFIENQNRTLYFDYLNDISDISSKVEDFYQNHIRKVKVTINSNGEEIYDIKNSLIDEIKYFNIYLIHNFSKYKNTKNYYSKQYQCNLHSIIDDVVRIISGYDFYYYYHNAKFEWRDIRKDVTQYLTINLKIFIEMDEAEEKNKKITFRSVFKFLSWNEKPKQIEQSKQIEQPKQIEQSKQIEQPKQIKCNLHPVSKRDEDFFFFRHSRIILVCLCISAGIYVINKSKYIHFIYNNLK